MTKEEFFDANGVSLTNSPKFATMKEYICKNKKMNELSPQELNEVNPDNLGDSPFAQLLGYTPPEVYKKSIEEFDPRTRELAKPLGTNSLGEHIDGTSSDRDVVDTNPYARLEQMLNPDVSDEQVAEMAKQYIYSRLAENNLEGRDKVLPENIEKAQNVFYNAIAHDDMLESIVNEYAESPDMIDVLRINEAMRCAILEHLEKKLNNIHPNGLPSRVSRNGYKSPNSKGYEHIKNLKCKEYVCMLALSMMDGSFNYSREENIPQSMDGGGKVAAGQHRYAAQLLLDTSYYS